MKGGPLTYAFGKDQLSFSGTRSACLSLVQHVQTAQVVASLIGQNGLAYQFNAAAWEPGLDKILVVRCPTTSQARTAEALAWMKLLEQVRKCTGISHHDDGAPPHLQSLAFHVDCSGVLSHCPVPPKAWSPCWVNLFVPACLGLSTRRPMCSRFSRTFLAALPIATGRCKPRICADRAYGEGAANWLCTNSRLA